MLSGGFDTQLGNPADLSCWSRSRCLLLTAGNSVAPNGLFIYNGDTWRQYATVCGSKDNNFGRIVWAGPTEFWTITEPSAPQDGASNTGLSLCRFKNGEVVGSYSTKISNGGDDPVSDPFRKVASGACISPTNCWFGGAAELSPDASRIGSFHLHWNGSSIKTVYAPARRAVTDITTIGGKYHESLLAGPKANTESNPNIGAPPDQSLIHEIDPALADASAFGANAWSPATVDSLGVHGAELLAIDNNANEATVADAAWAVGGGATSGPGSFPDDPFDRGPVAAVADADGIWTEVDAQSGLLGPDAQLIDVSVVPGTQTAFAAVLQDRTVGQTISGNARVMKLTPGASPVVQTFGNKGTVVKIDCPAVDECWAATTDGWLYRYAEPGSTPPLDTEAAFATVVTFRPNEVIEQAVSDAPPEDDSLLFAPPPPTDQLVEQPPTVKRLRPAVRSVRSKLVGMKLRITFTVVRRARVSFTARKGRKVVASARTKVLRKGKHSVTLKLSRKRWPDRLSMKVTEPGQSRQDESTDDDVSTTSLGLPRANATGG